MAELAGRLAVVKVSGNPLNLNEQALAQISTYIWRIADADMRVIDPAVNPTLERSDDEGFSWSDQAYVSVNKLSGEFTFAADHAGDDIRVKVTDPTANYLPMSTAAYAHSYSYNRGADLFDVSAFLATHKKRIAGQKFASGTLSQWDVMDSYYRDALTDGEPVVVEFRGETAGDPQRVWALVESEEMAAAIDSPQGKTVSFISTDELLNI